jgi:integrase
MIRWEINSENFAQQPAIPWRDTLTSCHRRHQLERPGGPLRARVQHARFYFKAIFEEAVEQDLVQKNPARKLILPNGLRAPDKTTLSWDQLRLVLASVPLRDCILLTLDMTETFRPSELFALRWRGFDMDARTLTVSQTAYKGKLRDFGKTKKSLRTVHLPEGLAAELWMWKRECPDRSPEAFMFPNARKRNGAKTNGFIRTDNYRARVLKKLAAKLGLAKLNFQVLRRTMATLAQTNQRGWEPCRYLYEKYGRHEETRTPDLYRVKVAL